jgi:hypothetical protein
MAGSAWVPITLFISTGRLDGWVRRKTNYIRHLTGEDGILILIFILMKACGEMINGIGPDSHRGSSAQPATFFTAPNTQCLHNIWPQQGREACHDAQDFVLFCLIERREE